MPLAIVSVIVQIALIIHVLKTGRPYFWIFLLIFVPGIGALIYIAVEILPGFTGSLAARRAMRRAGQIVDPQRALRQHRLEYERNRSVETATRLANGLIRDGKHDEAIEVCVEARAGVFADDPTILQTLAGAYFAKGEFASTVETLDSLREKNPDFRSPESHLLYARALEEDARTDRAIEEYEALARYYPGVEARARLALLHRELGNAETATRMLEQIVEDARLAPKHFQRAQREWIEAAKKALEQKR